MRSAVLLGVVGMAFGASLLHCAQTDESTAAPDARIDAESVDPGADAATDAAEPVVVDDAGDGGDAGNCSVDNWCRVPLPSPDINPTAVWTFAPDNALAVGYGGIIHWDGKTWSVVTDLDNQGAKLEGLTDLWASGPDDVWASTQWLKRILHGTRSADGGLTWSSSETSSLSGIELMAGRAGELWVAGTLEDGTPMLERADITGGGPPSFTQVEVPAQPFYFSGLWVSANGDVWLLGRAAGSALVFQGKPDGSGDYKWRPSLQTGSAIELPAIAGIANAQTLADQNDIWALGSRQANVHHTLQPDGGSLWVTAPSETNIPLASVWMSSKDDAWAVGAFGFIRHWDGTSWKISQLSVHGRPIFEPLSSIHGSSPNDIWAVGTNVLVHHTGGTP